MARKLDKGVRELVAEARTRIDEVEAARAIEMAAAGTCQIVDIRDVRERARDGFIPGSFHCPRGMVEFWVDPESPYYKPVFDQHTTFLFHCAVDWRSALTVATLEQMGMPNVAHIKGGLKAWKEAGGPIETEGRPQGA